MPHKAHYLMGSYLNVQQPFLEMAVYILLWMVQVRNLKTAHFYAVTAWSLLIINLMCRGTLSLKDAYSKIMRMILYTMATGLQVALKTVRLQSAWKGEDR